MCKHHPAKEGRYGDAISDGEAHSLDHLNWTRRDFLTRVGAATALSTLTLGGLPVQAFGESRVLNALQQTLGDRILILIQLNGGNDGLNTIIPYKNDIYYQKRPAIGIKEADGLIDLGMGSDLALNPSLSALQSLWGNGEMAILKNVGYPSSNLSHFRATDIYMSASSANEYLSTGWLGRSLDITYPNYNTQPPTDPLAIQIGTNASMLYNAESNNMGITLQNPTEFYNIIGTGNLYDETHLPATKYGESLKYVRSVINDSFVFGNSMKTAYDNSTAATYPSNNALAASLNIVARLIKGNLNCKMFTVSQGSYDTHANQLSKHNTLLKELGDAVKALTDDLRAAGKLDKVMVMTFSEFGRRVAQNGSSGTDHGTSAPMFLFGSGVQAGFQGTSPSLSDLDGTGNIKFGTDFRSVYATILKDWLGISATHVNDILGQEFETLNLVENPIIAAHDTESLPQSFTLNHNYPNPFSRKTIISFDLAQDERVKLEVFDTLGRNIATPLHEHLAAGFHEVNFFGDELANGTYLYRLTAGNQMQTHKMVLQR